MKYREININDFLSAYSGKTVYYCPNPGNAGDAVIAHSTYSLLTQHGITYSILSAKDIVEDSIVFYGGGGNMRLVPGLKSTASMRFLTNNIYKNNELIVLPHTINALPKVPGAAAGKLRILCRERISYRYVRKSAAKQADVFLSKDMAFYLDVQTVKAEGEGELNAFRTDMEKTGKALPEDNIDVSLRWEPGEWLDEKETAHIAGEFVAFLNRYRQINTNRLHVAIVGALLGKEVFLYANNYYKNAAVYDYSMKEQFPNLTFVDEKPRSWWHHIFPVSHGGA